jgi:hypothetical protein
MSAAQLEERPPSDPPPSQVRAAPPQSSQPRWSIWLREPLLHFVILGGLLFAIDRMALSRADDPRTIVVGGEVDREAIEGFKTSRGREPSTKELSALRQVWLDNEVLYRYGLELQVDKGDTAIRERVIFKALSVIDSNVKLPAPTDDMLRTWFQGHREKYDEPRRFDFEEAALSGDSSEAAVRAFVKQLNGGTPGDAKAGLRVFKGRPESNIVQSYGPELAKTLATAKPGEWQALNTRDGWRAMRLNTIIPPKPAAFEIVRGPAFHDWTDATAAEQRTAAVRALARKYKIKHELPVGDSGE